MTNRFSSKVVLVTGGTGGLGRAVTLAFLHEGASVITTYIKKEEADGLRDAVGRNAHLEILPVDATDENACRNLVDSITARHGRLDVLVNTIGGYAGGKALWETDPETWRMMLTLNLDAGYNMARAVAPAMLREKGGAIVSIASKAAVDHAAGAAAYAASKAAALALFDCLAQDLKASLILRRIAWPCLAPNFRSGPGRSRLPGWFFSCAVMKRQWSMAQPSRFTVRAKRAFQPILVIQ